MTEPSNAVDPEGPELDDEHPGAPLWVKIAVGIVLILIVAAVVSTLAGGKHGPGMHSDTAPATLVGDVDRPFEGTEPPGASGWLSRAQTF